MPGVVITFDPAAWKLQFPEFAYLSDSQATNLFNMATSVQRNDGGGPICVAATQTATLYMLTAHVAQLFAPKASGAPASQVVGRIESAAEGSVNVSLQNEYPPGTVQWFQQTKYGSMYWVMTNPFRRMRYFPNPRSPVDAGIGIWGPGVYGGDGSGWVG